MCNCSKTAESQGHVREVFGLNAWGTRDIIADSTVDIINELAFTLDTINEITQHIGHYKRDSPVPWTP